MQFTNWTSREPLFHDPYESHESYELCQAIHGSHLFDSIGQGLKVTELRFRALALRESEWRSKRQFR